MSFSARDKRLLVFLGIVAATVLFWRFYLDPQLGSILKLKSELRAGKDKYNLNLEYGEKTKGMDSSLKILNQRLEDLRTKYPPVMNYDEVFIIVTNMAKKSGLTINSISFNKISAVNTRDSGNVNSNNPIDTVSGQNRNGSGEDDNSSDTKHINELLREFGLDGNTAEAAHNAGISDGMGYQLGVKISANGDTKQIKKFLSMVENLKSVVSYKDLQISLSEEGILNFNAILNFIGIADSNAGDYSMPDNSGWKPLDAAGKSDIFKPYEEYNGTSVSKDVYDSDGTGEDDLNSLLSELRNTILP
jgi:Tfp pilus assembly protein PilO